jgi:HEAT repeat protein
MKPTTRTMRRISDAKKTRNVDLLLRFLKDRDEVVRIYAAERLGDLRARSARDPLRCALLMDRSPIVRSYAAGSLALIADVEALSLAALAEEDELAQAGILGGLYRLGDREVLDRFLEGLTARHYLVRCATANSLAFIALRKRDLSRVRSRLRRALRAETTVAARSDMAAALSSLSPRHR